MKPNFPKSDGQLKAKALSLLAGLILCPLAGMATDPIYSNSGTISYSSIYGNSVSYLPQIDATAFYNSGIWDIYTLRPADPSYPNSTVPYTTDNTLNYTNTGTMTGSVGWEFDLGPLPLGGRSMDYPLFSAPMSANFFNGNGATITAIDGHVNNPLAFYSYLVSYLWISATNIVNKGTLVAGANGEIILNGVNVNFTHSQLEITPLVPVGSANTANGGTNYSSDTGISDLYWGTNSNLTIDHSPLTGLTAVKALPLPFNVGEPCGVSSNVYYGLLGYTVSDSASNNTGLLTVTATNYSGTSPNINGPFTTTYFLATNQFRQGVFVRVITNTIKGQISFLPTASTSNLFQTAAVRLSAVITNVITLLPETNSIYLVDTLASNPHLVLLPNITISPASPCSDPTLRPTNYIVSRLDPGGVFGAGLPGLGKPAATFFYDGTTFSNAVVAGGNATTYSVLVDNQVSQVPVGSSVTDLPGRVRIYADNLTLNQTHVRAEGQILIQATNLTSSANAIMDCQNLSYDLKSTNGSLNFANLASPVVRRLHGRIDMWSGYWTNYMTVITPNYFLQTNIVSGLTNVFIRPAFLVNVLQINLAMFVVDASGLTNTMPVTVQDLVLHSSTNIVISDSVNVQQSLLLDGPAATLQGNVTLSGAVQNWTHDNAPTLRCFTNNGVLFIPNNAHFGDDGPPNYLAFVNNGSVFAGGQMIDSVYLQINNGLNLSFSGGFSGVAQTAQLTSATINSAADIQLVASNLLVSGSTLSAAGALDFTVTNLLSDVGSGSTFQCQNGFNMWIPPATGSLTNTTIYDVVPGQDWVDHYWAGQDFGTNVASITAHTNNAPIGSLYLIPTGPQTPGYEPMFAFHGVGATTNGIYVNYLDLSQLMDYANEIQIDPNLTIYFISSSPAPSVLDGQQFPPGSGGFLRRVQGGISSFAMPKVDAYTQKFQLTANYNAATRQSQLVENIMPGQTNILQASTDLVNWVPIFTNAGSYTNFGPATITDPDSSSYPSRFYRFQVLP